jgi:hypothetical protein
MSGYDEAVATLYQAPLTDFVTERKRLAAELKVAGDKDASARIAKLTRPSVSAWAVNQLWWQERKAFEALIHAASRVKRGEREASKAHRDALAQLREHATRILQDGGNAATETTLRRVVATLSALAASGGFAPDPAGALAVDRDPPGFEALAGFGGSAPAAVDKSHETAADRRAEEAAKRAAEAEQRRIEEEQRKRRLAERERLSSALRDARHLRDSQQRELSRLQAEVEAAEQSLKKSQALLEQIEAQLDKLG